MTKQEDDTKARTGPLAEACIEAWKMLRVDIAIVGATNVRLNLSGFPGGFACDSEEEAMTKSLFLDSGFAELRCIALDSDKLGRPSTSSFMFCPIDKAFVDVVITDNCVPDDSPVIEWMRSRGITVLRALTCPHG